VLRYEQRAEKIGKIIGLPESKRVRILLPVGVAAKIEPSKLKLPFADRAWFNRYQE